MYEDFTNTITPVTDKFAPKKFKKCIPKPVPYMNKSLKQAVIKHKCYSINFRDIKLQKIGENFRRQRNFVTKLKRKYANEYFLGRCVGCSKTKDFLAYSQTICNQ